MKALDGKARAAFGTQRGSCQPLLAQDASACLHLLTQKSWIEPPAAS